MKREEMTNRIQEGFFDLAPDMYEQTIAAIEKSAGAPLPDNVVKMRGRRPVARYVLAASLALVIGIAGLLNTGMGAFINALLHGEGDKDGVDVCATEELTVWDEVTEFLEPDVETEASDLTEEPSKPSEDVERPSDVGLIASQDSEPAYIKESEPVITVPREEPPVIPEETAEDVPAIEERTPIIGPAIGSENGDYDFVAIGDAKGTTEEAVVIETR